MIEALRVMTYIKLSLPTGNWDRAFLFQGEGREGVLFERKKRAARMRLKG